MDARAGCGARSPVVRANSIQNRVATMSGFSAQHPAIAPPHSPCLRLRTPLHASLSILICLATVAGSGGRPATADELPAEVFELGVVQVTGKADGTSTQSESIITREQLDQLNRETVSDAVAIAPGVNLSVNSRNETIVLLRGFDPRQVPVFLDGIPQYVPYDGYIDFGRFTTFDLAEIRVAKGSASLLYGPNTLGGAINLVSRKPSQPLEGDARVGLASGGERKVAGNLGLRRGRWYMQAGWSMLDADSFPLPDGFRDYKPNPTDTGDERENAFRSDRRSSIKLGFEADDRTEFAIGYVRQDGEKGNPVYTGRASSGIRYWRWPWWDKESLYLLGNLGLGANSSLRLRAWEDHYGNGLDAFTNASYDTPIHNTSFPSTYEDLTRGASAELIGSAFANHGLHLALHLKEDRHRDRNPQPPLKDYRDLTSSLAIEDFISLGQNTSLRAGISRERREAKEVYHWPTGSTQANNGLIEWVHRLGEDGELFAGASHKTRFPIIKDRYSARMGRALPNPDLKPEVARHFEFGWRGQPWQGAHFEATAFLSRISDLIQDAEVASDQCGGTVCDQAQNIGRARHRGVELSLQQALGERAQAGIAYTLLDRDNLDDPSKRLTNSPRQRLFGHVQWAFAPQWTLQANVETEQGRIVTYSGPGNRGGFLQLGGYAIFGAKLAWMPRADTEIELGVRNLGDKWYELSEGYPMPGRSWFANLYYRY